MDQPDFANPDNLKAFYQRVIEHYGQDSQSDAIIEEAAELIHAICKYRQLSRRCADTSKTVDAVIEEIVDMQIALDQARLIFCGDSPDAEKHYDKVRKRKLAMLGEYIGTPIK